MVIKLATHATEGSTYVVRASFSDEDGVATVPTEVTWTLTDRDGTVVNSREAETVTPAAVVDIVLSGADLEYTGLVGNERVLTIEAEYTSTLGAALPLKAEVWFVIDSLVAYPAAA